MVRTHNLIFAVAMAAAAMLSTPATAADDPAIIACEAVVKPPKERFGYRRISAYIEADTVRITYAIGAPESVQSQDCNFSVDQSSRRWRFQAGERPISIICNQILDRSMRLVRAGQMDQAKREKPDLEKCEIALKKELERTTGESLASAHGLVPIASEQTGLRSR